MNKILKQIEFSQKTDKSAHLEVVKSICMEKNIEYVQGLEDRIVFFKCSDETIDRDGDIVKQNWVMDEFEKNPVILYGHDSYSLPVARCVKWLIQDNALYMYILFPENGASKKSDEVLALIKNDVLKAGSVGFFSMERRHPTPDERTKGVTGHVHVKNKIYEFSIVSIGSNPSALVVSKAGAMISAQNRLTIQLAIEQIKATLLSLESLISISNDEDFYSEQEVLAMNRTAPEGKELETKQKQTIKIKF